MAKIVYIGASKLLPAERSITTHQLTISQALLQIARSLARWLAIGWQSLSLRM